MLRSLALGLTVLAALAGPAAAGMQPLGVTVPPPADLYRFTILATDGAGRVLAYDGDTLYELQGKSFVSLVTGIRQQVWPGESMVVDPSGLAVNFSGYMAYAATGSSDHLIQVDIGPSVPPGPAAREITGARLNSSYGNYGLAVDPAYGRIFLTNSDNQDLYLVDTANGGSATLLKHFAGAFGGGIAFDPSGNLIVPVSTGYSDWLHGGDDFPVDLYRFPRSWLDDVAAGQTPTADAVRYATGVLVSGTGFVAADTRGNVYLQAADAIYQVDPQGALSTLCGDPSQNAFALAGQGFMGLAYDGVGDRLVFSHFESGTQNWQLYEYALPEPATLGLLAIGLLAVARRRR